MYEDVTQEYVLDVEMQEFSVKQSWALRAIVERLLEAIERGLWEDPNPELLQH
ncbi:MAG: hypothetical protein CM1200mP35_03420 [Chloroflexota bacterium]|nr:MAG: hypothetical protein CM1200mP35_03420 [Chloroflexota bacterium]